MSELTTEDIRRQIQDGAFSTGAIDGGMFDRWMERQAAERLATTREAIAQAIAHSMPGWNDDTSEGGMPFGAMRTAAEAHWERVNAECLRQGRGYADAIFAADVLVHLSEVDTLGSTVDEPRDSR